MSVSSEKFNLRNPAVKRILQEMKELQKEPSTEVLAEALEGNIFEWHFVIRGPPDTEFAGGIYHGRILLPPEYPFKPPSFIMLSPNGRFETGVKICLSISSHHPEHWQPSWSVRTALTALIAFMPSPGNGAIGSLDYTKEERMALAAKSRREPPVFGGPERQRATEEMHKRALLVVVAEAPAPASTQAESGPADPGPPPQATPCADAEPARNPDPQATPSAPTTSDKDREGSAADAPAKPATTSAAASVPSGARAAPGESAPSVAGVSGEGAEGQAGVHPHVQGNAGEGAALPASRVALERGLARENVIAQAYREDYAVSEDRAQSMGLYGAQPQHSWEDATLLFLASTLTVLIIAIVFRRLLLITGTDLTALL